MSNYGFVRNDRTDDYGFLKLQDKILEIMVYIDRFCAEHGVTYYLMGGSALGAMRHGGFIPWDDDIDIFMPYSDYMRFLRLCQIELDTDRFYLQREDTDENPNFFSKLRMNGTTYISEGLRRGHQGIFVDIMCLNAAAPTAIQKKIQYYAAGLLKASGLTRTNYRTSSVKKKVELFISKLLVRGPVKRALLRLVRKHNGKPTQEMTHLFGRAKYKNSFYPTEDFAEGRVVPFEQVQLVVPLKVEDYLTRRYGIDYMKMPDEKTKAVYQAHAAAWDTEIDYSLYGRENENEEPQE